MGVVRKKERSKMRVATRKGQATVREMGRGIVQIGVIAVTLGIFTSSCQAAEKVGETVEVEVLNVRFDHLSNSPVVILQDKDKAKAMPIWVGAFEAQAIAMEMRRVSSPRPLTHDLLKTILQDIGVVFEKAVVNELKENTYYARIYLTSAGKPIEVDSRPSDAIALALRFHKPIFVAKSLMERETVFDLRQIKGNITADKVRGITVQDLTEDLAAYFDLSGKGGVLVSDVEGERNASSLHRGDVILSIGDEEVQGVADFRDGIDKKEGREVTLRVQREGKEIRVSLAPE
jgi:bifunctional DNase/RNase